MTDLSPPSPQSPPHDDEDAGAARNTPTRHTATGAYKSSSPGQNAAHAKERNLMELLNKAAAEIRTVRKKNRQLMDENARLDDELKSVKAKKVQAQRQQAVSAAAKEAQDMKQRYSDLMTVHKAVALELEQVKEQLRTYQTRCREQQKMLQGGGGGGGAGHGRVRSESPGHGGPHAVHGGYAQRNGGRTVAGGPVAAVGSGASRAASASARPLSNQAAAFGRSVSAEPPQRGRTGGAPGGTFDAMASLALSRSPPRQSSSAAVPARSSSQRHVDPLQAGGGSRAQHNQSTQSAASSGAGGALVHHSDAAAPHREHRDAAATAAEERNFNDMMLSRLRRAIAPPPTKEQMAEVVHAMVLELVKSAARNGLRLDLKRVGPCLYECGRRKLHLSVDSRRLVVKCGGGHVDINEFIQRNRLWTAVEPPAVMATQAYHGLN